MTSPNDVEDERTWNHIGNSTTTEYNGYNSNENNNNAKIVISNVPSNVPLDELENMLASYGSVQSCEKINKREGPTQVVRVVFDTAEQAQHAISSLNNFTYQGTKLKVEPQMDRKINRVPGGPRNTRGVAGFGAVNRQTDFPLRILVPSEMVGAIIGRQGSTIRQITQQTRASRVDVHRKDNMGSVEKAITIYGNPENCTNACKKILEVMQQEAANSPNKPEITLKILAHNNLIGRIIGKGGNTIRRIMQDTDTKIAVSSLVPANLKFDVFSFRSLGELNTFNLERIITVKGTIENMAKAESLISAKLRQSYENDMQAMAPQSLMFPGIPPMTVMATPGLGYNPRSGPPNYQAQLYGASPLPYPPIYQPGPPPPAYNNAVPPADVQETVYLFIPNQAVGAIIGTKGSQIKNMIRFSNASIKIATVENEKTPDSNDRKVTIVGTPEAQWKAQYMIFEKMREEGFSNGMEEIRLTVEILVPSAQVGRIIGKGGHNVRELQRMTGASIKLPEHNTNNPAPVSDEEMTTVHIIGPFISVQSAQRRIRSMITTGPVNRAPRVRGPVDPTQ